LEDFGRLSVPARLETQREDFDRTFSAVLAKRRQNAVDVDKQVLSILDDVSRRGDAAVAKYTRRFDRLTLTPEQFRVTPAEVDAAVAACDADALDALEFAARRIFAFHRLQMPSDLDYTDDAGVRLGYRWTSVAAAGLYVPGGTAAYPSSVLMNAIPAKVAGVPRLVMTVPAPDGEICPLVLAAARAAGIDEILRIGGAQAIAALAFGTETIEPVDKIVGPGNAYVAAAKRHVFGTVGIDTIAGPSEVLVVADNRNDPSWIAIDLLAQAEHDVAAQSLLITDDGDFADAVCAEVVHHLTTLARRETAAQSWEANGCVVIVASLDEAPALIDRVAPEHLQLAIENPDRLAGHVRNAGAIFLGRYTPEALGDYVAGPNHVLPTDGAARFASGLSVLDFLKRSTMIGCGPGSLAAIGPAAITLAEAEGLGAHARSIALRLNRRRGS
jgi:histidinol dehydrogenase